MPVDQKALLSDCQKQLKLLEADLKAQADVLPDLDASLRAEWAAAREVGRVGDAFEIWCIEQATQAAVHWVLGCVFVRFLEDNALIDPLLAGPGDRARLAEAAEQAFYGEHPTLHERDWLLHAFRTVARLPGGAALFDERHNPVFRWPPTPDAAKRLVQFWRRPDPNTGEPVHEFTDAAWDTRFLGDLYQDLSQSARKKYALLQTPVFVEEFILDRTLREALKALPLEKVTVIDPTCGSGHFLLGAFEILLDEWEKVSPGKLREELVQRALDQVAGVDLNPFAVAIARFRLLIAAFSASGAKHLKDARGFRTQVATGDSLLHGAPQYELGLGVEATRRRINHAFSDEDLAAVNTILERRYAVVVGNPPYITPKDKALNTEYRKWYRTCYMKYALSVPFVERFWELAVTDAGGDVAGWVGQITANSFLKREFGKKLIEEFFPRVDLTHVIDTAGAYIPGHGTPTVILLGRARRPQADVVRAALGIRGEPGVPRDAAHGEVWSAIVASIDSPGIENEYVSVADMERATFARHPWTLGGGGVADLRDTVEAGAETKLASLAASIGFMTIAGEDDFYYAPTARHWRRAGAPHSVAIKGDALRDWSFSSSYSVFFPYDPANPQRVFWPEPSSAFSKTLWAFRTVLRARSMFGKRPEEAGRFWLEYMQFIRPTYMAPLKISFAEVSTHNHFALIASDIVLDKTAPAIVFAAGTDARGQLGILGLLNSSTSCFWLKQVAHNKGSTVDQAGARQRTAPFEDFYQFNGTKLGAFPVTSERPTDLSTALDSLARERQQHLPNAVGARTILNQATLNAARARANACLARMFALQEELDWRCYQLYGVTDETLTYRTASNEPVEPPLIRLGERAFEIVLARRMAAGEEETTWFARHGTTPMTELPVRWPADYRAVVERRITLIENDRNIGLIERPEYKRRWNVEPWEKLEKEALAGWLLDRLESPTYWHHIAFQTTRDLASRAATDPEFGQVAVLWAGTEGVALEPVIRELVLNESVPFLPALRYTQRGREKRRVWENTWDMQRREDAIDADVAAELSKRDGESDDAFTKRLAATQKRRKEADLGAIPRPPKYASADFQRAEFWRMRGALDVPKERFILYPYLNRDGDDAPLLGWAGWNHLHQADALAAWYAERTQLDGWQGERTLPLLAGMAELVPWLKQWHNELDPAYGTRPGDEYATWLAEALHAQGITPEALDEWEPPRPARRGGRQRVQQNR